MSLLQLTGNVAERRPPHGTALVEGGTNLTRGCFWACMLSTVSSECATCKEKENAMNAVMESDWKLKQAQKEEAENVWAAGYQSHQDRKVPHYVGTDATSMVVENSAEAQSWLAKHN